MLTLQLNEIGCRWQTGTRFGSCQSINYFWLQLLRCSRKRFSWLATHYWVRFYSNYSRRRTLHNSMRCWQHRCNLPSVGVYS